MYVWNLVCESAFKICEIKYEFVRALDSLNMCDFDFGATVCVCVRWGVGGGGWHWLHCQFKII